MTKVISHRVVERICCDSFYIEHWYNGIAFICLKELSELSENESMFITENLKSMYIKDKKLKLLIELGENTELTFESFRYFLKQIGNNNIQSCAIIVKSLANNLVLRFFVSNIQYFGKNVGNFEFDLKVFKAKDCAIDWLESSS